MLGKNGIKVSDHIFHHKFTLKFLRDHSLTPCMFLYLQGVFEVEAFLLTCDSMRCSKEF
jgi:hypothetical protein